MSINLDSDFICYRLPVRETIINLLYRHYVLKHTIEQTHQELLDNFQAKFKDENHIVLYEELITNLSLYENLISDKLKKTWSFDRLNNYEKAILVNSAFELVTIKIDKKIVINEAMIILKQYSIDENYKYVNKILDLL